MVDRLGPNAIQAVNVGGFRELSAATPPILTALWPYARLGGYFQGSTIFPMTAAEVTRRARYTIQVWTAPYVGYSPSDFNNAAAQVHAAAALLGHTVEIYLYFMPEFQPTARPSSGLPHWRAIWDFTDNNNFWAYGQFGLKNKIPPTGTSSYVNHVSPRKVGGFNMPTFTANYIKNGMGLNFNPTNGFVGVMTDNTQNDWTYGYDPLENNVFENGRDPGMIAATVAEYQRRSADFHAMGLKWCINGNSWMYLENCRTVPINSQAALADLFDVGIFERPIGEYGESLAVSQGRIAYKGGTGAPLRQLSNCRTYPGGAVITTQPPEGTRYQTIFGGWEKGFGGATVYGGAGAPISLRGLYAFGLQGNEIIGTRDKIIAQNKGPGPTHFNIASGLWAEGDYHARFAQLHGFIVSNYYNQYMYQDLISPQVITGVATDMDEITFSWGTPRTSSSLGLPQLTVNHGDGMGNGINGTYMRILDGGPFGPVLLVSNPAGNGPQDIDFPPSDGPGGRWQRIGSEILGRPAQALWNNNAVVGLGELGYPEHNASVYVSEQ